MEDGEKTLEGLQNAYKNGYIYVWTFSDGIDYHAQKKCAATESNIGKTSQIISIISKETKPKMLSV